MAGMDLMPMVTRKFYLPLTKHHRVDQILARLVYICMKQMAMVDIAMYGICVPIRNSLPGLGHGDIDADGNHEIYFGVSAGGSNDDTWGTLFLRRIMEFPTTATHLQDMV